MKLSFGALVGVIVSAVASMQRNGLLDATGNLVKLSPIQVELEAWAKVVADLEPMVKALGVTMPAEAEKILLALPQMLALV